MEIDWAQHLRDLADECVQGNSDRGPHNVADFRAAASDIDEMRANLGAACNDVGELTTALLAIAARLGVEPVNLADGSECLEAIDRLTRDRDHLLEIREQLVGQREWASQQIDRLTRERDEARAEVRALCGEPEALDPFLPEGWAWGADRWRNPARGAWVRMHGPIGCFWDAHTAATRDLVSVERQPDHQSPLAAMRAADKALEDK